jgi:hypothetical protein
MAKLLACPFCRQLFPATERTHCPDCDIALAPLEQLPLSHDAQLIDPIVPDPPEFLSLPWWYWGRMRGVLLLLAAAGMATFFAPWLREYAPEVRVLSGYEFAHLLGWLWAPAVAWFILFALVLSRRSIQQMRGARLAVILLAVMVLLTVLWRLVLTPDAHDIVPRRYEWGWGLYAAGALALAAMGAGLRFGGALDDSVAEPGPGRNETVH